jgi:hypothetical protein
MASGGKVRVSDEFKEAIQAEIVRLRGSGRVSEARRDEKLVRMAGQEMAEAVEHLDAAYQNIGIAIGHMLRGANDPRYAKKLDAFTSAISSLRGKVDMEAKKIARGLV